MISLGLVHGPAPCKLGFDEFLAVLEEDWSSASGLLIWLWGSSPIAEASNNNGRWWIKKNFKMATAKIQAVILKRTTDRAHKY